MSQLSDAQAGMVKIAVGNFRFGEEKGVEPGIPTKVAGFWIDKTEVTVHDYAACVASGQCTPPHNRWDTCNWPKRDQRGQHPINCVDWTQANAFCSSMDKRLSTEQEWEFAARGSDGRLYPWGEAAPKGQVCLKHGASEGARKEEDGTCPVSQFAGDISPFRVLGMAGNVKEWTSSVEMLSGKVAARVIRGGGWSADPLSPLPTVRVLEREYLMPSEFASDLGFRCASDNPVARH